MRWTYDSLISLVRLSEIWPELVIRGWLGFERVGRLLMLLCSPGSYFKIGCQLGKM